MDQYLANQLTTLGVFQVVADPQKADAIITDRLGEPFEAKLKDLYPPPPPPHPLPAPPKDKDAKDDKDSKTAKTDKLVPVKDDKDTWSPAALRAFRRLTADGETSSSWTARAGT